MYTYAGGHRPRLRLHDAEADRRGLPAGEWTDCPTSHVYIETIFHSCLHQVKFLPPLDPPVCCPPPYVHAPQSPQNQTPKPSLFRTYTLPISPFPKNKKKLQKQLSAIMECADAAHGLNGLVVGDGGCTCPGDVAKVKTGLVLRPCCVSRCWSVWWGWRGRWVGWCSGSTERMVSCVSVGMNVAAGRPHL